MPNTREIEHPAITHGAQAPSCTMVIFGAAGDLTKRLLLPALYNLARTELLPANFALVGVDRLEMSDDAYRQHLDAAVRAFAADKHYSQTLDEAHWGELLKRISYMPGDFSDPQAYGHLKHKLAGLRQSQVESDSVLFYLAVGARFFGGIVDHLGQAGLLAEAEGAWRRVVVEKPFGNDVASARALNAQLRLQLYERQIYRMDHFLGKETVQNIMLMRFANAIFEPLWNRDHIDHVQITVAETVGVESRAAFYEGTGALRDMVPNHVFQ